MKVDFMIIGVQKCGTTSLAYQLEQHPQINFCLHKEPDFFSKTNDWETNLETYHHLFNPKTGQITGEASTTYTWYLEYPDTAQKLYDYNPNLKIICILRNPIQRILSHFTYYYLKGKTKLPIDQEVFNNPTYIDRSRYAVQLKPYLKLFPKDQIKVIIFEEYIENPQLTLIGLAQFLQINAEFVKTIILDPQNESSRRIGDSKLKNVLAPFVRFVPLNVRNYLKRPFTFQLKKKFELSNATKQRLQVYLELDILEMEKFIGRPLPSWRKNN